MKKRVKHYTVGYTPNGNGRFEIFFENETRPLIGVLGPIEFAALLAVLSQREVIYEVQHGIFWGFNHMGPNTHSRV